MLCSWCLLQHRATEPSAPESLHSTFLLVITTTSVAKQLYLKTTAGNIVDTYPIPNSAMPFNKLDISF